MAKVRDATVVLVSTKHKLQMIPQSIEEAKITASAMLQSSCTFEKLQSNNHQQNLEVVIQTCKMMLAAIEIDFNATREECVNSISDICKSLENFTASEVQQLDLCLQKELSHRQTRLRTSIRLLSDEIDSGHQCTRSADANFWQRFITMLIYLLLFWLLILCELKVPNSN